ncbi:MAG: hypothetical protein ACI4XF_09030 [Oscillospiraceae bacterium]
MKCIGEKTQEVKELIEKYMEYLDGNTEVWFTIAHKHNWDGGYICGNGEYYKKEDFAADFEQMMNLFVYIAAVFNCEKIKVYPIGDNIFEHWSDNMSHYITKEIAAKLRKGNISFKKGQGFETGIDDSIIKEIICAVFNYLADCIFVFDGHHAVIPTHNFEFRIYAPDCALWKNSLEKNFDFVLAYV